MTQKDDREEGRSESGPPEPWAKEGIFLRLRAASDQGAGATLRGLDERSARAPQGTQLGNVAAHRRAPAVGGSLVWRVFERDTRRETLSAT